MADSQNIALPTMQETQALADKIVPLLRRGDVLLLRGDLGVGKTAFARCALLRLGVTGEVPSPTFTLVQTYDGAACSLYHFDLYRLKTPHEAEEIGFADACGEGIVFVEWPDKAAPYLPREALSLHFSIGQDGARSVKIEASRTWQDRIKGLWDANRS